MLLILVISLCGLTP